MSKVRRFQIGDQVRWVRAVPSPELQNAIGTITAVILTDHNIEEFTMYDVTFHGRQFTVYATQIDAE
jgi:hypothetical protein